MVNKDTRPLFSFDFGARQTEETLRTRLLVEAELCLAEHGRPQRQMLDELRAYIVKSKGSDSRLYPILRILHRYLNVTPTDFRDLVALLGLDKALEFIDGVRPPTRVWDAFNQLYDEGVSDTYIREFWHRILDGIESGEEDIGYYDGLRHDYLYTNRGLRPGYQKRRPLQPSG